MPKNDRETDARLVAREYEQGGLSVREIAAAYGLSYGKVHKLLAEQNVRMRPRGGNNRGRR